MTSMFLEDYLVHYFSEVITVYILFTVQLILTTFGKLINTFFY